MNYFFKNVLVGFVFSILAIVGFGHSAQASYGGLVSAKITGPNEITVTYTHVLDNNTYTSYSNLGMGLSGRSITGTESTTDHSITLSFDGLPVAPNITGTIDIDNTVTWGDAVGGFAGTTGFQVDDAQQPALMNITLNDTDSSGTLTAGDVLNFWFDEPMNTSVITTDNIDSELGLTNSHTLGTTAHGLSLSWNPTGTILSVTVGSDITITSGDAASAASDVTDAAGNYNNTPTPLPIPVTAVTGRTLYYNDAVGDDNWTTLGNWWNDSSFTDPASSLPTAYDDVIVSGRVYNNVGNYMAFVHTITLTSLDQNNYATLSIFLGTSQGATFNDYSGLAGYLIGDSSFSGSSFAGVGGPGFFFSQSMIVGNVTFNGTTANYGTVIGNTTFYGSYGNAGLIYGTVDFHDTTSNPGEIVGNVSFYDNSFNGGFGPGIIQGNADVYYPSENPISGIPLGTVTYHGYSPFAGGTGTQLDPYLISTCLQLQNMSGDLSAYYKITTDIDCSSTSNWNSNTGFIPLGTQSDGFTGHLDGTGHVINNLFINLPSNSNPTGLFGFVTSSATISNIGLTNESITGGSYTGGIAGWNNTGTISRSYVTGSVTGGSDNTGGIAGYNASTIQDSYSLANVTGSYSLGGLVGQNSNGPVINSYAAGTLTGGVDPFFGGAIGYGTDNTSNVFWDTTVGPGSSYGGTGESTELMKTKNTFADAGWNFDTVWGIDPGINNGYPYLQVFDSTTPVLTEITPIPSQVTADSAKYYFSASRACALDVSPLSASPVGSESIQVSGQPLANQSTYFSIDNAVVGTTYSFNFSCTNERGDASNTLDVGPFTIIAPTQPTVSRGYTSGGGGLTLLSPNNQTTSNTSTSSTNNFTFKRTLKLGLVGDDVKQLQVWLNTHGFVIAKTGAGSPGHETSKMGPATVKALKALQVSKGLKGDGIFGSKTAGLLTH